MAGLTSMTGFGTARGEADWGAWSVEAKSVNGRSLDVRVSLPPGFDALERFAKSEAAKRFSRGNLQVAVRIDLSDSAGDTNVDTALLDQLTAQVTKQLGVGSLSAEAVATLMTVRGVVDTGGTDLRSLAQDKAVLSPLQAGIAEALDALAASRAEEGRALHEMMTDLVAEFRSAIATSSQAAETQPGLLRDRLVQQLDEIGAREAVDADRLAAEIALSVAKADVREELDRLNAHLATAETLLAGGSPVGRKLDFLSQEIGREANTLCSKSASLDLTNAGLALKTLNDQFKEQAANVE